MSYIYIKCFSSIDGRISQQWTWETSLEGAHIQESIEKYYLITAESKPVAAPAWEPFHEDWESHLKQLQIT